MKNEVVKNIAEVHQRTQRSVFASLLLHGLPELWHCGWSQSRNKDDVAPELQSIAAHRRRQEKCCEGTRALPELIESSEAHFLFTFTLSRIL